MLNKMPLLCKEGGPKAAFLKSTAGRLHTCPNCSAQQDMQVGPRGEQFPCVKIGRR